MADQNFQFNISLSVLNHLGRNLYRNFITVLGEAISNAWDADAKNVWIDIDKENSVFSIKDDGNGMTADDFQNKFLKIGYSKRKDGVTKSDRERPFIGAKGIGKLALLSCAERVSVYSKTSDTEYVGGVIDNRGLDKAIQHDMEPSDYPLEDLDFDLVEGLSDDHEHGTIIVFQQTKEAIRNSKAYIKKLLAMSFRFSLLDDDFTIYVDGDPVTIADLKDLAGVTQIMWNINGFDDEYLRSLTSLKADPFSITTPLDIKGFIASVVLPRQLKISGTEERATIDLFVNGRLRDKNILRHIPTQRVVESYIYGQIHFDTMDRPGVDPFTSSREGIVEGDENFEALLKHLSEKVLPRVFDDWDRIRLALRQEGDDENMRKSKRRRKASALFSAASSEYAPKETAPGKEQVDGWLKDLHGDAEFNIDSYVDCFLSENLVRKFIDDQAIEVTPRAVGEAKDWQEKEFKHLEKAGISFDIRTSSETGDYVGMDTLVEWAEGKTKAGGKPSLIKDAINYRPVRNAVCHTGLLTDAAKQHLSLTFTNIRARIVKLVSREP